MSKKVEVTSIDKEKVKKMVVIRNILIIVVLAVAIVTLLQGDFFKVKANYLLTKENLQKVVGDEIEIPDIDENTYINVEVGFSPITLFKIVAKGNEEQVVKVIVDEQVGSLLVQAKPVLSQVMKVYAKGMATKAIDDYKTELAKEYPGMDVDEILAQEGLTPEVIESVYSDVDVVIDKVISGDSTSEEVTDDIIGLIDKVSNNTLTQQEKEDAKQQIKSVLDEFTDKDTGKIDIESALVKFLDGTLSKSDLPAGQLPQELNSMKIELNGETAGAEAEGGEKTLNDLVYEKIMEAVDANTIHTVSLVMKIVAIVLICIIAVLGLGLIFMLLRTLLMKRKAGGTFLYGLVCFLPFFILVIVPSLAIVIVPNFISQFAEVMKGLELYFSSFSIIAFICSLLLIVIAFVFGRAKKREKILYKAKML